MGNKFFRLQRIKQQLKIFIALCFTLFSAFLFVVSTHSKALIFDKTASFSRELFLPIFDVVSTPIELINNAFSGYRDYLSVYEENKRLKAENKHLQGWKNKALSLSIEQQELAKLLNYQPAKEFPTQIVRVLGEHHNVFSHSLILDAGKNQGLKKGNVLLLNNALFGHVIDVGEKTSRALKLTDYFSRLPVFVGQTKEPAILMGNNSSEPDLVALPEETVIEEGDFVFSAGMVGVYPQGLAIGYVKKTSEGFKVRLIEDKNNLGFVHVVDFNLSGLIENACSNEEPKK